MATCGALKRTRSIQTGSRSEGRRARSKPPSCARRTYAMQLFLINLDRQPERLARMETLFAELGLALTRLSAIDGRRLDVDEAARWQAPRPDGRTLAMGETACFLSHRACWQRIVEDDLPAAAIFEDDLHVSADAGIFLKNHTWLPADADVVKIETKLQYARLDKAPASEIAGRGLYRLRSRHAGAGGYIVTRSGAEKMLASSARLSDPVDQFIFNPALSSSAALVIYQLLPAICVQDFVVKEPAMALGLGSDLHAERAARKPKGLEKLWREMKRPLVQLASAADRFFSNRFTARRWVFVHFS